MSDDEVRYNVKMPRRLREDAKRNTERGDLATEVRKVFRREAYGEGSIEESTELDKAKSELQEVREHIDNLRRERGRIDNEIESQETRAARLEERISSLEQEQDEIEHHLEMLENMLQNGERVSLTRIKNATDMDDTAAMKIKQQLRDRNPEIPDKAFELASTHEPTDWREVTQS